MKRLVLRQWVKDFFAIIFMGIMIIGTMLLMSYRVEISENKSYVELGG